MSRAPAGHPNDSPALETFLRQSGLLNIGESFSYFALTGGVSSDIWRVECGDRSFCVKRALQALRVSALWEAPTSRNENEWNWLRFAAARHPNAVPTPLAHDARLGLFAMSYLPTERYPVWKQQLMKGWTDTNFAAQVGRLLAELHNESAGAVIIAQQFDTLSAFYALRLEPYFLATAEKHPSLAPALRNLVDRTAATRIALVHGDVSPKNILIGPDGPVLLDAECAWYGDPAFDIAFCLSHLLLKSVAIPARIDAYLRSFEAMITSYLEHMDFESVSSFNARAAALLPALLLARVDGKSPVEYLIGKSSSQQFVREFVDPLILMPLERAADIADRWGADLRRHSGEGMHI